MAKLHVVCAYDGKIGAYVNPFLVDHLGQALRAWDEGVNDGKSMAAKFPHDFILYEIATFDTSSGVYDCIVPPKQLATALEVKKKDPQAVLRGLDI